MIYKSADDQIALAKETIQSGGKTTLDEMLDSVQCCANQIETEQRARLVVGFIKAPDQSAIQHVCRLDDLGRLLEAMISRPHEVARRLNRSRR